MVSNTQTTNENEDWLRSMHWDLPDGIDVAWILNLAGRADDPPDAQRRFVSNLMKLPFWEAAPAAIRAEAEQFTSSSR